MEANDVPLHKCPLIHDAGSSYLCCQCVHLIIYLGGVLESTFFWTNHTNVAIDASIIQLKKALTMCIADIGEVDIVWPDNLAACNGILRKEIFVSSATKNIHKVSFIGILFAFVILMDFSVVDCF